MKQFIFLLCFLLAFSVSKAQVMPRTDSTRKADTLMALKADTVHISLSAAHHAFIIAYMPDKAQIIRNKYLYTILPSMEIVKDSTGRNKLKTPAKLIKYAAPVELLGDLFLLIGSHQERLVAATNREIQTSLFTQLQRRADVLQRIGLIVQMNAAHNEQVVQVEGIDYLAKLKE